MKALHEIIENSWSEISINEDDYHIGQSDITALVVNTLFGGRIIKMTTPTKSHYCNIINGIIVDYTNEPFKDYTLSETSIDEVGEESLLENPSIKKRYLSLLKTIYQNLKTNFSTQLNSHTSNEGQEPIDSPYTFLELNDYYDGGAYEMVGFTLGTATEKKNYEYLRDKEDGTIALTSKMKRATPKIKNPNPQVIEQVFALGRENKDTIETLKVLEKTLANESTPHA